LNEESPGEEQGDKKKKKKRVAVVHCKAGKGRSGTVACSYLISQEGWKMEDALQRFTERRMRVGFGDGVSIPSQVRWVGYVNRWANHMGKVYVERPVEILEVHVWGLRDGVKIALEGYVDEGKKIKCFHLFRRKERIVVDDGKNALPLSHDDLSAKERLEKRTDAKSSPSPSLSSSTNSSTIIQQSSMTFTSSSTSKNVGDNNKRIAAAILRPDKPVILPTSDVNIDFERRIKAAYTGWAMVTSIAHVWFNAYFEGGDKHDSGIFECDWEGLDGIKGSTSKGTKALERVKIVWRYASKEKLAAEGKEEPAEIAKLPEEVVMTLPKPGEPVHESHAADWHGANVVREDESGMDFSEHRSSVVNPTSSPVRYHQPGGNEHKSTSVDEPEEEEEEEEEEALNGTTHPFIAQASASTAAAVTSAVKRVRRELGLRKQTAASAEVSLANSSAEDLSSPPQQQQQQKRKEQGQDENGNGNESDMEGVKSYLDRDTNTDKNTSAARDV
jgi:protein-tyrosine phosphatase